MPWGIGHYIVEGYWGKITPATLFHWWRKQSRTVLTEWKANAELPNSPSLLPFPFPNSLLLLLQKAPLTSGARKQFWLVPRVTVVRPHFQAIQWKCFCTLSSCPCEAECQVCHAHVHRGTNINTRLLPFSAGIYKGSTPLCCHQRNEWQAVGRGRGPLPPSRDK